MRRKLNSIRLDKIAGVDSPCQEHATIAIIKRRPGIAKTSSQYTITKATFAEALSANMTADAVNDAFYGSFDGLWERNDAFRTALTDELSAGGDGGVASAAYVESVKSLVDEAVAEARKAGATAADTSPVDKALNAAVDQWLKSRKEQTMKITTKAELKAAVAKFNPETSPYGDVLVIRKAATDLEAEDELPAAGPLAKEQPDPEVATMKRELAILKLAPEAKSYFDTLDEAGQTSFLGKSKADQDAAVAKANEADPVVYTTQKGREIRKSHGQLAADLARDNDELREDLTKVRGDLTGTSIEKRASEKYPNVAKAVAVQMLKSVAQVGEDTDAGKAILGTLDTMNKGGGKLMKSIGSSEGGQSTGAPEGIAKARGDFDSKVNEIAARDKIGKADAMTKVREEHPDLFKAAYPDTAAAHEDEDEEASA